MWVVGNTFLSRAIFVLDLTDTPRSPLFETNTNLSARQQNLVKLANEKISERDNHHQLTSTNSSNTLQRPTVDVASQRTSLPDISLTPRERDILEQTSAKTIRASHSTESILRDSSPPPKPPLPDRKNDPPPLPPKRKSQKISQNDSDYGIDSSLLVCGLDR